MAGDDRRHNPSIHPFPTTGFLVPPLTNLPTRMLDENLPTFYFGASSDDPLASVVFFTHHGSEPSPEYLFRRADPASARGKYAVALTDPLRPDVVYAEVLVEPEWQTPALSAAEVRTNRDLAAAPTTKVPESFTIRLYNPDQAIAVKMVPSAWNHTESWEFETLTQSFRVPSASQVDRQQADAAAAASASAGGATVSPFAPKIMFKWKRDGRLSKDMTCYNVGRSLGKHKSKDPDITIALFKQARESAVTIYEPNLQRVDVEDRKGLEIVLILGAEVIRDLYLTPRPDVFNLSGAAAANGGGRRKNSRPAGASSSSPTTAATMSGALGGGTTTSSSVTPAPPPHPPRPPQNQSSSAAAVANAGPSSAEVAAETKRLQALMAWEQREQREREKRDREEQTRIKKMLEEEDKERRKREAEVARETERLRKMYGTEGQELPSSRPGPGPPTSAAANNGGFRSNEPTMSPALPPRHGPRPAPTMTYAQAAPQTHLVPPGGGTWFAGPPAPPPRPVSAGPFDSSATLDPWRSGPAGSTYPIPQHQQHQHQHQTPQKPGRHPAAAISTFFHRDRSEDDKHRLHKKRSTHF